MVRRIPSYVLTTNLYIRETINFAADTFKTFGRANTKYSARHETSRIDDAVSTYNYQVSVSSYFRDKDLDASGEYQPFSTEP